MAREMFVSVCYFIRDKKYHPLADMAGIKPGAKGARNYLAKSNGTKGVTALAIPVNGFISNMLSDLYIRFSKSAVPVRNFYR